jgi:hypothetical protein
MAIIGIERLTAPELTKELKRGGKFVTYSYCFSCIFVTVKRSSDIYFIRAGQSAVMRGLPFTLLSFLLGWWGIPFGPIFTVWVLITNFLGGNDVTSKVVADLRTMGQFFRQEQAIMPLGGSMGQNASGPAYSPGYTINIDRPPEQRK